MNPIRTSPLPRASVPRASAPRVDAAGIEVLAFAMDGMRFALPGEGVIESLDVEGERWQRLARMSEEGILPGSGLPLLRLSSRLGVKAGASRRGTLLLVGHEGKVRGTVLLDATPVAMRADVMPLPASVHDIAAPHADLIVGIAALRHGERAILLRIPTGIAGAKAKATPLPRVLLVAPAGPMRERLRDMVRGHGHEVSLADDPRAARLARARFDVILFDLDAYPEVAGVDGEAASCGARLVGLTQRPQLRVPKGFAAAILAGDAAALLGVLRHRQSWAA